MAKESGFHVSAAQPDHMHTLTRQCCLTHKTLRPSHASLSELLVSMSSAVQPDISVALSELRPSA